jgi:hypothetical protein
MGGETIKKSLSLGVGYPVGHRLGIGERGVSIRATCNPVVKGKALSRPVSSEEGFSRHTTPDENPLS